MDGRVGRLADVHPIVRLSSVTRPGVDPAAWADRITGGVQDLGTGRALALDRPDPQGS